MKLFTSFFNGTVASDPVDAALSEATVCGDVGPWRAQPLVAIGGLTAVGFARTDETLLVCSSQGQSVIDAATGTTLYRNHEDDGLDWAALKGTRLDHPADERFDMAGLPGGGLRSATNDGWSVMQLGQGDASLCLLHPPGASVFNLRPTIAEVTLDATFHLLARERAEIRAFGFSWTGRSLVLATASDLRIWSRDAPLTLT